MRTKQSIVSSFINAFKGLFIAFSSHRNLQLMILAAIFSVALGIYCHLFRYEWAIIIICIFSVIGAELLNTALEETLDHLHPDFHEKVGRAKDIAAGAVLLISIGAVIVGLYIFIPKFM